MKKMMTAVTAMCAFAALAEADQFEKGIWGSWNKPAARIKYERSADKGKDNSGALRLVMLPDNPAGASGMFIKSFPVEEGFWYRAEVSFKQDGDPKAEVAASISLNGFNEKNGITCSSSTTRVETGSEWKTVSVPIYIVPGTKKLQVLLCGHNGKDAAVLFDDFKLEKKQPEGVAEAFDHVLWGIWKSAGFKGISSHAADEGRTAKGAIALHSQNDTKAGAMPSACFMYAVPVKPGEEYTFTVFVKSKNLVPDAVLSMGIQAQNSKRAFLGLPSKSAQVKADACADEWKRLVLTFRVPSEGKWKQCAYMLVTLGLRTSQPGTALFDDFEYFNSKEE
ncbi:MAG: hypothetical protein E7055_10515 [Lentisphaerae bacterium]|nr:hypothetical protein [Lentisphaerota bacterium]